MPEYRAVRKQHSLLEICKKPALAAEVTITAAEFLGVDAAIIFADLLLPLEVMGLPFHFSAGEGPVIEKPVRTTKTLLNSAPIAPPNSAMSPKRWASSQNISPENFPSSDFAELPSPSPAT